MFEHQSRMFWQFETLKIVVLIAQLNSCYTRATLSFQTQNRKRGKPMDNERRSPIDRLLFATFLKGRTSSRDLWDEKGEMSPEDNQKIVNETNEIINDDSTYPFINYLTDLLAKSKPSDAAVKKLHDLIDQIAAATGHDSTDIFRVLLAKLIEKPEEQQTFDTLLELAEKIAAKH